MGRIDYLVVGLGNPGAKYILTRHNAGFLVLDHLAQLYKVRFKQKEKKFTGGVIQEGDYQILIAKPLTYMNLSGEAVKILLERYHLPLDRVIIISDDVALPFGSIKLKPKGSSGGHKGLASIITQTGTVLPRLRVGIGAPPIGVEMTEYVLGKFSTEEEKLLPEITLRAARAIMTWVEEGTEKAMSVYNGLVPSLRIEKKQR